MTAESLQYFAGLKKYVAQGSVKIEKADSILEADRVTYYEDSTEAIAEGNVRYKDRDTWIKADKAELNMERKNGRLFNAEIFQKKDNYHLAGREIEKIDEDHYYSTSASFTVCDAPVPAWCFKGKEVNTAVGEKVTAKDVSFRIKGIPVLYAPYFWASLVTERQTGFLQPTVGSSHTLGQKVNIPFFWAISENSDATVSLDEFTKRGFGTGLEYRLLGLSGLSSNWWFYHISDKELEKDFVEIRGLHDQRRSDSLGGFLSVNYVNESDYYRVYSFRHDLTTLRFLESTGELNLPLTNSRIYLLAQYRVDLQNDTGSVPQKLPELGYFLSYSPLGPFLFSADFTGDDFWRENGLSGGRLDLYPKLLYSYGSDLVLTQMFGLRETVYDYYGDKAGQENRNRSAVEYNMAAHTRFSRSYPSFTHIVEPSVGYHLIYTSSSGLPVFDSTEFFDRTSAFELSVLNRILIKGSEAVLVRLTQALDTYRKDGSLLPFKFEANVRTPLPLVAEATYDLDRGRLETVTSNVIFNLFEATLAFGERYSRAEDAMMITGTLGFSPFHSLRISASTWYDIKGDGLKDLSVVVRYLRQCWGIRFEAVKRPGDFGATVKFELAGLGSKAGRKDYPTGGYEPF